MSQEDALLGIKSLFYLSRCPREIRTESEFQMGKARDRRRQQELINALPPGVNYIRNLRFPGPNVSSSDTVLAQ